MTQLIDQSELRERKLLVILDILHQSDESLSVAQIQYRLAAERNTGMTRAEIDAHLQWGVMQPNATNSPIRPVRASGDTYYYVYKHPATAKSTKAAGPAPWLPNALRGTFNKFYDT
jgi:hypothetical protein